MFTFESTELKTYRVEVVHNFCGGKYQHTGTYLATHPPKVKHKCDVCGDEQIFAKAYPATEMRPE